MHGDYIKLTVGGTGMSHYYINFATFVPRLIPFVFDFSDPDSAITGAVITKMPTNGMLYSVSFFCSNSATFCAYGVIYRFTYCTLICRNL